MVRSFAPGNWRKLPASKHRHLSLPIHHPGASRGFSFRHPGSLFCHPGAGRGPDPLRLIDSGIHWKFGSGFPGNCSMRCSRQLLLHCSTFARPWARTSCVSAAVPDAALTPHIPVGRMQSCFTLTPPVTSGILPSRDTCTSLCVVPGVVLHAFPAFPPSRLLFPTQLSVLVPDRTLGCCSRRNSTSHFPVVVPRTSMCS